MEDRNNDGIKEIEDLIQEIIDADNYGDIERVLKCYTEDVIWLPPDGSIVDGITEISNRYTSLYGQYKLDIKIIPNTIRIGLDSGTSTGITQGRMISHRDGSISKVRDRYMMSFRKVGNTWKVSHLMWTNIAEEALYEDELVADMDQSQSISPSHTDADQPDPQNHVQIRWRMNFRSSPDKVYTVLNTNEGRSKFWAESAEEKDGMIYFRFPSGFAWEGKILERVQDRKFSVDYIGHTTTVFILEPTDEGGTDLLLEDLKVGADYHAEVNAGWVSVLMNLKAVVDFGIDLRNHDPSRTWDQGFADN